MFKPVVMIIAILGILVGASFAEENKGVQVVKVSHATASNVKGMLGEMVDILAAEKIITGEVKLVSDDRANTLIVVSDPDNTRLLQKLIKVLDVKTLAKPDVELRQQPGA